MKTIRQNAEQVLIELYKSLNDNSLSLKEYAQQCASADPNFFNWLFDDEVVCEYGMNMTDEQRVEADNFIDSL